MRCLIIPCPDTTSLNIIVRCMSIGAEAIRLGHEVATIAPAALLARFSHLKMKTYDYPLIPYIDRVHLEIPPIQRFGDYAELIGLNDWEFICKSLEAEANAIHDFKPDVIYSDLSLTASISARIHHKPLASLCNLTWTPPYLLDDSFEENETQVQPFNEILVRAGLQPIRDLSELIFMFSDLKIVPGCPEFERFPPNIRNLRYVGYLYSEALEEQRFAIDIPEHMVKILVYMGIGDIDLDLMRQVLPAAFDGTSYHALVVVGDFYADIPPSTKNVTYYRFLPLKQVLEKCDLVIFHGGSGLVLNCLLNGVPGLMFPCGVYEREFHAEMMSRVGAGIVLYEKEQFNVQELLRNIELILRGDHRKKAGDFGRYLRSLGGPERAVELLDQLAANPELSAAHAG